MSSWNSPNATGLAMRRLRDGETATAVAGRPNPRARHVPDKSLRSNDNNQLPIIILAGLGGLLMLGIILTAS